MINHYVIVKQVQRELASWRADAAALERWQGEGAAAPLKQAIRQLEACLIVDLDTELERHEVAEATGLSDRSIDRRPDNGERGPARRWAVRDLMEHHVPDDREETVTASSIPAPVVTPARERKLTKEERREAAVQAAMRRVS